MKERLDQLRATIDHHNHMYYVMGQPEIPDSRYDQMFRTLVDLEAQYPEFYDPNSPTARVGSDLRNEFPTFNHITPMLSVNAVETAPEIEAFIQKGETICQLKYDGVGINLIYKNGKLFRALTRGDGFKGADVTTNIRTIRSVPYTINTTETIEIRGEVWCTYSELWRLQSLGEDVHSPVAVAINTIKVKQSATCARRNLTFTAFHVVQADLRVCPTHTSTIHWLQANHFDTPVSFGMKKALRGCSSSGSFPLPSACQDIAADGIVFKHDDLTLCNAEGHGSRNVNWAVAWKFDKEIFEAKVAGIGGKVASGGRVTPLIFIDPVVINNETISKIPVTAADLDTGIAEGDTISIRRKGTRVAQLIPSPYRHAAPSPLLLCPQCSAPLIRRKSLLYCPANCQNAIVPPAGETYKETMIYELTSAPPDFAMVQYIVRQNNCRLMPVNDKVKECRLYFKEPRQLADIGFAIGCYLRKF